MKYGHFIGKVVAIWCVEVDAVDRKMELVEDFTYVDPKGTPWPAPKGRKIDGATIPEFLWGPIIGSPYTGDFRRASVVHDIACQDKPYTSYDAHLMFYHSMLCDKTTPWLAKVFYTAVRLFGPQWGTVFVAFEQNQHNISTFVSSINSSEFTSIDIDSVSSLDDFIHRIAGRLQSPAMKVG